MTERAVVDLKTGRGSDVVKGYCDFSYTTKTKKCIFRACSVQRQRHIWQHHTCLELTTEDCRKGKRDTAVIAIAL